MHRGQNVEVPKSVLLERGHPSRGECTGCRAPARRAACSFNEVTPVEVSAPFPPRRRCRRMYLLQRGHPSRGECTSANRAEFAHSDRLQRGHPSRGECTVAVFSACLDCRHLQRGHPSRGECTEPGLPAVLASSAFNEVTPVEVSAPPRFHVIVAEVRGS